MCFQQPDGLDLSEARDMVTKEKRARKLRGDGGIKRTKIDAIRKLMSDNASMS